MPSGGARALRALVIVAVAAAGVAVAVLLFTSRDESQIAPVDGPGIEYRDLGARHLRTGEAAPGRYASDPPTSGAHRPQAIVRDRSKLTDDQVIHALELGDVVLFYGTSRPPAALTALADELSGPFDAQLVAAGQAVVLARRPGTPGVIAAAWRHLQPARAPGDPAIRAFTEYWLGRGR